MTKGKLLSLFKIVAMGVLTIVLMCIISVVIFIQAFPKDPQIEKVEQKFKFHMTVEP